MSAAVSYCEYQKKQVCPKHVVPHPGVSKLIGGVLRGGAACVGRVGGAKGGGSSMGG